eukprot:TRINITY_DN1463_c0_g2_i1.p1 TRINITY_DN1463_c0_g2~~TRINITY_DN1463_c0_g2_i1.p1  ORF type:complete len:228 (+),score=44.73 TRINITY_DN1463_c0_g2_i1:28-684(+)
MADQDVEVVTVIEEDSPWLDVIVAVAIVVAVVWWKWSAAREAKRREEEARRREELKKRMHIEPKNDWKLSEIKQYTGGTEDEPGPIVFAVKDTVFNVWRGRHFYGPEGAYHCFAGEDATIMMAMELLEPPTEFEKERALTRAELSTLDDWFSTFAYKYDDIGKLAPGEGIWEREPEKRRIWDEKAALYAPSGIAAAAAIASCVTTLHEPVPKADVPKK